MVTGPVLVIPYREDVTETVVQNGRSVDTVRRVNRDIYLSSRTQKVHTVLSPQRKHKSIYTSNLYEGAIKGTATFALPASGPMPQRWKAAGRNLPKCLRNGFSFI